MPVNRAIRLLLAALLFCGAAHAASLEEQIDTSIAQLRGIRANASTEQIDLYNKQMDAAWRLYFSDKKQTLPILRARLEREVAAAQPSDLVLLDLGLFVHENDDEHGKALARNALYRLNPRADIIDANLQELFQFTYAVAKTHDPQVLPLIASFFMTATGKVSVPQHAMVLDGTLMCVFLYGVYGEESEAAVRAALSDKALAPRALEVLTWLGSPASLNAAAATLEASPDYATLTRVVSYMMRTAGPAGRAYVLALDPARFDAQSSTYLASIRDAVSKTSYARYKEEVAQLSEQQQMPDTEVAARLDAMIKNAGRDDQFSPVTILNAGLPRDYLIAQLEKNRASALRRLSDEALDDVQVGNVLINALRYKN